MRSFPSLPILAAMAVLAAAPAAAPAFAQVEVAPLTALDLFSNGSRETGLGDDVWKGASADIARQVIPQIGTKPLSPAARALAVRLLSTGAAGPDGAGDDPDLVAARARALLALGEPKAAAASVARVGDMSGSPALSEVVAEVSLITGDDARACKVGDGLATGRDGLYWLRLRAYCQALAGQGEAAQLTLTLANEKGRDPVFSRLLNAVVAGAGDPGAGSFRNGLEVALSRKLGLAYAASDSVPPAIRAALDPRPVEAQTVPPELMAKDPLAAARMAVQIGDLDQARAIRATLTQDAMPGVTATGLAMLDAAIAAASGQPDGPTLDRLIERGALEGAKSPAQPAAALLAALGAPIGPKARDEFAGFDLGKSALTPARATVLELAAGSGLKGETALLALSVANGAGLAGPSAADRAQIIRALRRAGLETDARAFAVEGLLGPPAK